MTAARVGIIACVCFLFSGAGGSVQLQAGTMPSTAPTSAKLLDVCEALQNAMALNGTKVAVRGYYRFRRELAGLYGRNCPKKLIVDGKERAQAFDSEGHAKMDTEFNSVIEKMFEEQETRSAVLVTVTGTLNAISFVGTDHTGPVQFERQFRNFGYLGVYPAQIKVDTFSDVKLIDAPEFPSTMRSPR
jgi:hypothetical protein